MRDLVGMALFDGRSIRKELEGVMRISKIWAVSCSMLAMLATAPAMAQDAETDAAAADTQPADDSEIIVTATLRSERLQDVPIAVTAFNGDSLERSGVKNLRDLGSVAASFSLASSNTESGGSTARIRGIGTLGNNTGLEGAVGIFLDGVYLTRPGVALGDLLDVEQVEVLRGPQGTLFGRNTSAGAIQIKTRKPDLNDAEGFANFTYGNYDLFNVQGGVSVPIVAGQLAARVSGAWRDRDGWFRNGAGGESNDRNRYIVRGQLLWEPSADLSLRLIGDYASYDEKCCDSIIIKESSYVARGFFAAAGLPRDGGVPFSGPESVKALRNTNDREYRDSMKQWGVSGQIDWTLGDAQVTSITAYRHSVAKPRNETDIVPLHVFSGSIGTSDASPFVQENRYKIDSFSQELRIAGSALDDRFDYLAGAYYVHEKFDDIVSYTLGTDHQAYISVPLISLGLPGPNPARDIFAGGVSSAGNYAVNNYRQSGRNWSVFTNNTFHFSDRFAFNFGVRYSNDRKHGVYDQLAASSPACAAVIARQGSLPANLAALAPIARALTCFPFTTAVGVSPTGPTEFDTVYKNDQLVYTAKLLGELGDNVNTYLSYSRGYKAGGINLDSTAAAGGADPRFRPEKVDAYEAGIKTTLLDRKLTANLALFYQKFTDFQLLEFSGIQYFTYNVPKSITSGFEIELTARPSREFTVNAAVTYADARFPKNCAPATAATQVKTLCGYSLPNAPKWAVVAGFDYAKDIGSDLSIGFNASARMESDRRTNSQAIMAVAAGTGTVAVQSISAGLNYIPVPYDVQDGNVKVNLRAGIGRQDDRWRLEFWGTNIFNVITYAINTGTPLRGVATLPGPNNAGGIGASRVVFPQEPRMYGVTLRTKF